MRREKDALEAVLAERAREAHEIEAEMAGLRDDPAERERRKAASQKRLAELRSALALQQEAYAAEAGRAQEQILGALGQLADFKSHLSRKLADQRAHLDHAAQRLSAPLRLEA